MSSGQDDWGNETDPDLPPADVIGGLVSGNNNLPSSIGSHIYYGAELRERQENENDVLAYDESNDSGDTVIGATGGEQQTSGEKEKFQQQ